MQTVHRVVDNLQHGLRRHDTLLPEKQAEFCGIQICFSSRGDVVFDRNGGVGGCGLDFRKAVSSVLFFGSDFVGFGPGVLRVGVVGEIHVFFFDEAGIKSSVVIAGRALTRASRLVDSCLIAEHEALGLLLRGFLRGFRLPLFLLVLHLLSLLVHLLLNFVEILLHLRLDFLVGFLSGSDRLDLNVHELLHELQVPSVLSDLLSLLDRNVKLRNGGLNILFGSLSRRRFEGIGGVESKLLPTLSKHLVELLGVEGVPANRSSGLLERGLLLPNLLHGFFKRGCKLLSVEVPVRALHVVLAIRIVERARTALGSALATCGAGRRLGLRICN